MGSRTTGTLALLALLSLASLAQAQDAAVSAGVVGQRADAQGATKLDGRFSVRDVYSFDNQTGFDIHLSFLDADLRGQDLARVGGARLNFNLDSRFLLDWTGDTIIATSEFSRIPVRRQERRFGETQTFADVNQLYVQLEDLGPLNLTGGRVWLYEAGGAWVDGAHLELKFSDGWSAGFYGGLQPDPYDYLPTTDRQTSGSFVQFSGQRVQASLAYTTQLLNLTLDRHFVFSRAHWSVPTGTWSRSLFLSYYASLDLQNEDPTFTTLFTNASWWFNDALNFSAHYARFATSRIRDPAQRRALPDDNQRELLGNQINIGAYQQVRLSLTERFNHYNLYQQIDFRSRNQIDERSAIYYRAGVRDNGFLGTQLFLHGRLTVRNNFWSDSTEFMLESGYRFGTSLELDGALIYQTGRSLVANQSQDVYFGDLRATWSFTPEIYLSLDYNATLETGIIQEEDATQGDLLVHTLFSRFTYRL